MRRSIFFIITSLTIILPSFCTNAAERTVAERDYRFAEGLQKRGLYEMAAKEYIRFLDKHKGHPGEEFAWLNMIECYKQAGDTKSAGQATRMYNTKFKGSRAATSLALRNAEDFVERADELLKEFEEKGDKDLKKQAEALFKRAVEAFTVFLKSDIENMKDNDKIMALYHRAYCSEQLEEWRDAIKDYEDLVEEFDDYEAQFKIGDVYYNWAKADSRNRELNLKNAFRAYRGVYFLGERGLNPCYDDAKIAEALARIEYGKLKHKQLSAIPENEERARKEFLKYVVEAREILQREVSRGKFEAVQIIAQQHAAFVGKVYVTYLAPRAFYMVAECYELEGDKNNALAWLKEIPKRFPKSDFVGPAQSKIADLLSQGDGAVDIAGKESARRALDVAKNHYGKGEFKSALEELMKLKREYSELRDSVLYKEYLATLMRACHAGERYLIAGVAGEHLAKITASKEAVDTPEGRISLKGDALHHAGTSYWYYAEKIRGENEKASFQKLAVEMFEKLARYIPSHPHAAQGQLHAASYFLDIEEYEKAARNYVGFLSKTGNPGDKAYEDGLFNLAYCYLRIEDYAKAEEQYSRYISTYNKKNDRVVEAIDMLGVCRLRQEKYDEAIGAFGKLDPEDFKWISAEKLEEYKPRFQDANYFIARAYYDKKDMKNAAVKHEYFIGKFPDNPRVPRSQLELAQLYFDGDQHEKVVRVLAEFTSKYADHEQAYLAHIMLVESYLKTKDFENALKAELEIFRVYGSDDLPEGAYGKLARIMKEAGQPEGARIAYQELISDSKDDSAVLERALWASAEHAFETMEKFEKKEKELAGKNELTAEEKTRLEEVKEQQAEFRSVAAQHYGEYITVAQKNLDNPNMVPPRYFQLQFRLGDLHARLGEYAKAEAAFNKVAAKSGDPALVVEAQYRVGFMYLNAGDPKKALGSLFRIALFPPKEDDTTRKWIAYATFEAGRAHLRNGEPGEARKRFRTFLDKYGEDPDFSGYSSKAKELLEQLDKEKPKE